MSPTEESLAGCECPASSPYVDAPVLAGRNDVDHWHPEAARVRLNRLASALPLSLPPEPVFTGGNSNDVWDLGDDFLHVCWRGDRDRLLRDAQLRQALPAEIPHAPVRDFGRTDEVSWVLSGRVPGRPLFATGRGPSDESLREIFRQMMEVLRALHQWSPPVPLRTLLSERPRLGFSDPLSVWAADLLPLPASRVPAHLDLARALEHVDRSLLDAVGERIRDLAGADPFAGTSAGHVVVHGDPWNFLVQGDHVSALIDFEWARMGPPDLELVVPLFLVQRGLDDGPGAPRVPYLRWMEEDYPSLFQSPDLDRRLWLYELCFALHGIIWWPPCEPDRARRVFERGHPMVNALRQLVEGPYPR